MSEIWQMCGGGCGGTGVKTEYRAAIYYTDEAGNKLDNPQIRTAAETVSCGTCLGTGQVPGGSQ